MRVRPLLLNYLGLSLLIFFSVSGIKAQSEVSVVGQSGEALLGVEVYTNDFSFSSTTDNFGKVTIPILNAEETINFKYLGFEELAITYASLMKKEGRITLKEAERIIEEILIVGRTNSKQEDLPYTLDYISSEEISFTNPQTSADALQQNAEVFVQKSQMGGGSPVIRGFEANRVLLVVDGVRMNNAIYRNGHLQNAITIDAAILDQTEILYGPGSLIYGSDALGGVVHFRSKNPLLNYSDTDKTRAFGNAYARYATVNDEKSFHFDYNLGFKKIGLLSSFTISDFGDLKMGSKRSSEYPDYGKRTNFVQTNNEQDELLSNEDPDLQIGSAYKQYDFLQKILFHPTHMTTLVANIQYSTSSDIPRYDALIEREGEGLKYAEWYYGPQTRFLSSFNANFKIDRSWADELIIIPSYQYIEEDRVSRLFNNTLKENNEETVHIGSVTVDLKKDLSQRSSLLYGIDFNYNNVFSDANSENINNGEILEDILTRYPGGGSSLTSAGLYSHFRWQAPDSTMKVFSGLRFNFSNTSIRFSQNPIVDWPSELLEGLTNKNTSLTWSLGFNYLPGRNTIIRIIGSSAFRAPNVDDLAKIRVRKDEISFPNLDLKPEKSVNIELGLTQTFSSGTKNKLTFNITGFYTRLNDAIVRQSFLTPGGESTFVNRGDTLAVVANVNAEDSYIAGVSTNIEWFFARSWTFKTSFNLIRGRVIEEGPDSPLAHIPPTYGKLELNYHKKAFKTSIIFKYNGRKALEEYGGSTDNPEFATSEGSLSWYTINSYVSYKFSKLLELNLSAENILDHHYRPFASGLNGPGRNLIISLKTKF